MIGSLFRANYNSTYALISYVYLNSYRTKQTLSATLLTLIIITAVAIAADFWALFVEKGTKICKGFEMAIIIIEIGIKILLLILLMAWKFRG